MQNITTNAAIIACINEAGISTAEVLRVNTKFEDGMYEVDLNTSYQHYNFYVDAATAEVLGMNAEPDIDDSFSEQTLYVINDKNFAA